MADALAFLYWTVKVDSNDIEFVLDQPLSDGPPVVKSFNFYHSVVLGTHALWILDFDCCNDTALDDSGIEKACRCFWRNDPYYPRPCSSNASNQTL